PPGSPGARPHARSFAPPHVPAAPVQRGRLVPEARHNRGPSIERWHLVAGAGHQMPRRPKVLFVGRAPTPYAVLRKHYPPEKLGDEPLTNEVRRELIAFLRSH